MAQFNPTTLVPDIEDSLLTTQKKALLKRSYQAVTAFPLASRTSNTSTGVIANPGYKGIIVSLLVTAYTAGGLRIRITTGVGNNNTVHYDSTSLTAALGRTVAVYPGLVSSAAQFASPGVLGTTVTVSVEHDTADPITYSLAYSFIE